MELKRVAMGIAFVTAVLAATEGTAFADACIRADNGVGYQLQIGRATPISGTPIVVTGTRVIATLRTTVVGSFISMSPKVVIGLTEMFEFGSGSFTHPQGTTVITFPGTPGAFNTYDTTFHGNGAPHNVKGFVTVVACPLAASDSPEVDPNRK
jgi:hypothetical protein